MSALAVSAWIGLCAATGWWVVVALTPPARGAADRALRAVLALGVAAGAASLATYASLWLAGELHRGALLGSAGAFTAAAAVLVRRREHRSTASPAATADPVGVEAPWALAVAAVAAVAAARFVLLTMAAPHGTGDAQSIWNLRARLLFGAGTRWRDAFSPELAVSHPDYPLLLPGAVAGSWESLGDASVVAPAALAFGFTCGAVALLALALARLRGPVAAVAGAACMLAFPGFVEVGSSQLADVPLSFYCLAAVVLLEMRDRLAPSSAGPTILAGLMLGLAAWTKNEGMLLCMVLLFARVVLGWRRGRAAIGGELRLLGLGAAVPLAALLTFKLLLVPANDLVVQAGRVNLADRVFDAARWVEIGRALVEQTMWLGPVGLAGVVAATCCSRRRFALPLAVTVGMLLAYCAVYLLLSRNLTWHLATSLPRLLVHLLPTLVFGVFSGVARLPRSAATTLPGRTPPTPPAVS